jgi:hypothetical protein
VKPVEGVRDVDEPALPPDLSDGLGHRHPALDPFAQEEADHLALVGGLHLLGDDHLDPADACRDLLRLQCSRDLVVVGDRDCAQPALLGGLQQQLRGGGAVGRVVSVHVQVAVDVLAFLEAAPDLRIPGAVVPPRDQPAVDLLDLIGHLPPGARLGAGAGAGA